MGKCTSCISKPGTGTQTSTYKYPTPLPRTEPESRVYVAFTQNGKPCVNKQDLGLFYHITFMSRFNASFSYSIIVPFTVKEFVENPINHLYAWIDQCKQSSVSCDRYIDQLLGDLLQFTSAREAYLE